MPSPLYVPPKVSGGLLALGKQQSGASASYTLAIAKHCPHMGDTFTAAQLASWVPQAKGGRKTGPGSAGGGHLGSLVRGGYLTNNGSNFVVTKLGASQASPAAVGTDGLALVVEAWPKVSEPIRRDILAMIVAAR